MTTSTQPGDGCFVDEYQDWCRTQYQMAHHDIWWPKQKQIEAISSTFLLLGAIVGASKLLWPNHTASLSGAIWLSILSAAVVGLGITYAWNLYLTMVRARQRAQKIARLVHDPHHVLAGALENPWRNWEFPVIATIIHVAALCVVVLYYLSSVA